MLLTTYSRNPQLMSSPDVAITASYTIILHPEHSLANEVEW